MWGFNKKEFVLAGSRIYSNYSNQWQPEVYLGNTTLRVRGLNSNDILASGASGLVAHYNGLDWHRFTNINATGVEYFGIQMFDQQQFIVGRSLEGKLQAIALHGERN